MNEYPFLKIVQGKLKADNKTQRWLLGEIDLSESWFLRIKSIKDLKIGVVEQISQLIDFDLIADYYRWCKEYNGTTSSLLSEPTVPYKKKKNFTLQFTVSGDRETLAKNLGNVLSTLEREGDKSGLSFE